MKRILFRGGVLTQSGYGVHARQIFRYVNEKCVKNGHTLETQVLPWGDTPWIINPDMENGLIGRIMETTVDVDEKNHKQHDVSVQIQLPNEWNPNLGKYNVGVTAGIESDRCKSEWINTCLKMNKVIVPSTFSKQCFVNTAAESLKKLIDEKIVVIPESFPDAFINRSNVEGFDSTEFSDNNVLIVGQITGMNAKNDRKNLFYAIRWICEFLKDKNDWGIIVKTNAARNTNIDRSIVMKMMKQVISEVRSNNQFPKVHILHGNLDNNEMLRLYSDNRVKVFVSLTRGEGYGLPLLEAASVGVPVIATNWSGHLDFLNDNFMKVPYELTNVPDSLTNGLFAKGSKWADPSQVEFKKIFMSFVNNKQYRSTQINKAKKLKTMIQGKYSFKSIQKLYDKEIGELFE